MAVKVCFWISVLVCLIATAVGLMVVHDVYYNRELMIYGPTRILARASASAMKPCLALCLIFSAPGFFPAVRWKTMQMLLPISQSVQLHLVTGYAFAWLALLHVLCHIVSNLSASRFEESDWIKAGLHYVSGRSLWMSEVAVTGWVMTALCLVAFLFACKYPRIWLASVPVIGKVFKEFNYFYYTHFLLLLMLPIILIHPVPTMHSVWSVSHTLTWIGPILLMIILQRIWNLMKQVSQKLAVKGYNNLSCGMVYLHLEKPQDFRFHPGYAVSINIPEVSVLEWHPFSIASAPHHKHLSFVIGTKGDWTSRLASKLKIQYAGVSLAQSCQSSTCTQSVVDGCKSPTLQVNLRHAIATRSRHTRDHETVLLIAGGSGISTFLSLLTSLTCPLYRASKLPKLRSLTLVWSVRNVELASLVTDPLKLLQQQQEGMQAEGRGEVLPFSVQLYVHVTTPIKSTKSMSDDASFHVASPQLQSHQLAAARLSIEEFQTAHLPTQIMKPLNHTTSDNLSVASSLQKCISILPENADFMIGSQTFLELPEGQTFSELPKEHAAVFSKGQHKLVQPVSRLGKNASLLDRPYSAVFENSSMYGFDVSRSASLVLQVNSSIPAAPTCLEIQPSSSGSISSSISSSSSSSDFFKGSNPSNLPHNKICRSSSAVLEAGSNVSYSTAVTCILGNLHNCINTSQILKEEVESEAGDSIKIAISVLKDIQPDSLTQDGCARGVQQSPGSLSVEVCQGRPDYAQYMALICKLRAPHILNSTDTPNTGFKMSLPWRPAAQEGTVGVFVCGTSGLRESAHKAFLAMAPNARSNAKWYDQEFQS